MVSTSHPNATATMTQARHPAKLIHARVRSACLPTRNRFKAASSHPGSVAQDQCEVVYPIEDFDYGMREFAIRDNSGYLLQFGQPIA